jgi:PhzF family phenazine biosynthesis protein
MPIKIYHVDAFCRDLFSGNPAAVCPLGHWPEDAFLQHIAAENNLPETAFYVKVEDRYRIRWFSPTMEVDLCGHATLATAHVLFDHEQHAGSHIVFLSRSGELIVSRQGDLLELDFPTDTLIKIDITDEMRSWFPTAPQEAYKGRSDYLLVFPDEGTVEYLQPNISAIAKAADARGVIVTARGDETDFVSRFFAPQTGINEDPVTGSAHTSLTPYWSARLGKKELTAMQLSPRKGYLQCSDRGARTGIRGAAKTYLVGELLTTNT